MRKNLTTLIFIAIPTFVLATTASKTETEPAKELIKEAEILVEVKKPEKPKEPEKPKKLSPLEEKQKRINEICAQMLEEGPPQPIERGLRVKFGKAVEWVANNANKPDGWSLSGYAKLKMDKNGNMSRWKFGIINGELDWALYNELEDRNLYRHEKLDEWNRRKQNRVVFGIFFSREF